MIIGANPAPPRAAAQLVVDAESAGQRLDNFLFRVLKGVPRSHVWRIIRSGEVRLNKARAAADTRIAEGDFVRLPPLRVSAAAAQKAGRPAPAREFAPLFEDEHLIALDKPAGVAVHGGSGVAFGVIEQLRRARPEARFLELVHRLDRETSGVLLIAKKRSALTRLQAQFRDREVGKTYLALVAGDWPQGKKVIDLPLLRYLDGAGERRVRVAAREEAEARRAITLVGVERRFERFTLLEVTIRTGRTHQIRVHLAASGCPIAGDEKYGDFELNRALQKTGLKRMFLHAAQLTFTHPVSGELVRLRAPLPAELEGFLLSLPQPA